MHSPTSPNALARKSHRSPILPRATHPAPWHACRSSPQRPRALHAAVAALLLQCALRILQPCSDHVSTKLLLSFLAPRRLWSHLPRRTGTTILNRTNGRPCCPLHHHVFVIRPCPRASSARSCPWAVVPCTTGTQSSHRTCEFPHHV